MEKLFYLLGVFLLLFSCTATKPTSPKSENITKIEESIKKITSAYPKDKSITEFESPQYPAGTRELLKFLGKTMNYPLVASRRRNQGKVYVQILVSKLGQIQEVKLKKSSGYALLDKEAVRVVGLIDEMLPAKDSQGDLIDCYMNIPITFRLGKEVRFTNIKKR